MEKSPIFAIWWSLDVLHTVRLRCEVYEQADAKDHPSPKEIVKVLAQLSELCKDAGFFTAMAKVDISRQRISSGDLTLTHRLSISTELRNVIEAVMHDAGTIEFIATDPDFAGYIDRPDAFGDSVMQAFPEAHEDLRECANCMAVGCYTAAVFHGMRVVECGLSRLCADWKVSRITQSGKRSNKYLPISFAEWGMQLDQVEKKVNAKIQALRKGPAQQRLQEVYFPILKEYRAIKDAWRNHLMHGRATYTKEDARAILEHSRLLMVAVANHKTSRQSQSRSIKKKD